VVWPRNTIAEFLRSTAYHEAAHAVAVLLLFKPGTLLYVELNPAPTAERPGGTVMQRSDPVVQLISAVQPSAARALWKREFLIAEGVRCYAGVAAQFPEMDPGRCRWLQLIPRVDEGEVPNGVSDFAFAGSENDRHCLADVARGLGLRRPADRWHQASWRRAKHFVAEHWSAIEAVAAALLQSGHLDGDEVARIIEEAEN
jgi:hypothetical protein